MSVTGTPGAFQSGCGRSIRCDNPRCADEIIINVCRTCEVITLDTKDYPWIEELCNTCEQRNLCVVDDYVIRNSFVEFYKKMSLYHHFVFDYNGANIIKDICDECVSEFIVNNVYIKTPKDKSDQMLTFVEDYLDLIWNKDDDMDLSFHDAVFAFEYDYIFNTNIFRLNYAGTEDYFYFISVPDGEQTTYMYNADEYPIYVYYSDTDEIEKKYNNFYDLMDKYIDDKNLLSNFSRGSVEQEMPISENEESVT